MRAFALGGVLQILRSAKGWSVEQAAVHAGLGHMTWRRMEDGFNVRAKTYAAVDQLFELPFGTVKRALNDDLLMVKLIERVGVDISDVTTGNAAAFVERFAKQTLSRTARQTVRAKAGAAEAKGSAGAVSIHDQATQIRDAVERAQAVTARAIPVSDVEAVAAVLDRLTRRELTPRLDAAVKALLDAMPDLIRRDVGGE